MSGIFNISKASAADYGVEVLVENAGKGILPRGRLEGKLNLGHGIVQYIAAKNAIDLEENQKSKIFITIADAYRKWKTMEIIKYRGKNLDKPIVIEHSFFGGIRKIHW